MNQVQNKMEIAKRQKKVKNEFPANSFTSDLKENADLEEYLEASQRESNNLPNFDDSAVLSDWDWASKTKQTYEHLKLYSFYLN